MFLYSNFNIEKKVENLIIIISILYISIQYVNFQKIIVDRYIINNEEKNIVISIKKQIEEYEKEESKEVKKVVFCYDEEPMYTYSGLFISGDLNIKAFYSEWSAIALMKYYTERNLEFGEKDLEIEEYFKQKNWDFYDPKQIIIKEDTVYICVF